MRYSKFCLLLSMTVAFPASAQDYALRGKEAFEVCATCHGELAEGNEDFGAPRLAGQHGWYLKTQLYNFKAGIRGTHEDDDNGQVMQPVAEVLNDQTIEDLVAYILTLTR